MRIVQQYKKLTSKNMQIEITKRGYIKIIDIINGYWIEKFYRQQSEDEAKKQFKKYVREVKKYNAINL